MNSSTPERVSYSPKEFAALFGKSQTWGYRQIYAGRVKTVTKYGRCLVPASEVQKILEEAGVYEHSERPRQSQKVEMPTAELADAWEKHIAAKKLPTKKPKRKPKGISEGKERRLAALSRLRGNSAGGSKD